MIRSAPYRLPRAPTLLEDGSRDDRWSVRRFLVTLFAASLGGWLGLFGALYLIFH
jgi:hypothetical protein